MWHARPVLGYQWLFDWMSGRIICGWCSVTVTVAVAVAAGSLNTMERLQRRSQSFQPAAASDHYLRNIEDRLVQ